MLPEVRDCRGRFGVTAPDLFGAAIPILGIAGDQQAATIGQACLQPGMMKATYGTGCFALLNTGAQAVASRNRLLTTIAYQLDGERTYALEGSIFIAGAAVQWLRDGLGVIRSAAESHGSGRRRRSRAGRDPGARVHRPRRALLGARSPRRTLRPDAQHRPRRAARAALLSVACQTHDLVTAAYDDWAAAQLAAVPTGDGMPPARTALEARLRHDPLEARLRHDVLRVDGGMAASDFTMQALADILDAPVERPRVLEATAVGAAWLAGSAAGLMPDRDAMARNWNRDRRFEPQLPASERTRRLDHWRRAVAATIAMSRSD